MQQVDRDEVLQPRDGGPRVAGRLAQHHGVVVLLDRLQHRAHLDHRVARHHWRGQHHHTLRTTSPDTEDNITRLRTALRRCGPSRPPSASGSPRSPGSQAPLGRTTSPHTEDNITRLRTTSPDTEDNITRLRTTSRRCGPSRPPSASGSPRSPGSQAPLGRTTSPHAEDNTTRLRTTSPD